MCKLSYSTQLSNKIHSNIAVNYSSISNVNIRHVVYGDLVFHAFKPLVAYKPVGIQTDDTSYIIPKLNSKKTIENHSETYRKFLLSQLYFT